MTAHRSADRDDVVQVAFDTGPLLGPLTGVGVAVAGMRATLSARDDVSILPYACSFRGNLPDGVRRLPLPAAAAHRVWARSALGRVDRWLRPAQVVHGTNYVVPPSRMPRVVSVYDCWFLRHPQLAAPAVRRAGEVLRRSVRDGATVHASSHATARAARELLDTDSVEVIPLAGPTPTRRHSTNTPAPIPSLVDASYVLALGTVERRKNLPALVAAFDAVHRSDSTVVLVIAGSNGDDREAVDSAIDRLTAGARERVVVTGRIEDSVKQWLVDHATVLAYPSLDEGFGFPLLEAMAHDLPIVASTAGSIPEVAGDAALLVDAADVDGLGQALLTALHDPATRDRLIAAGRQRTGHFSWSATADGLTALYHRLAGAHEGNRS